MDVEISAAQLQWLDPINATLSSVFLRDGDTPGNVKKEATDTNQCLASSFSNSKLANPFSFPCSPASSYSSFPSPFAAASYPTPPFYASSSSRWAGGVPTHWWEAVDLQEPLVVFLFLFHFLLWTAAAWAIRNGRRNCLAAIFLLAGALVLGSKSINQFCSYRWEQFSSQNYFDEQGSFAAFFWAFPLLSLMLVLLVNLLLLASRLLVEAKTKELKASLKERSRLAEE
eukprot:GHVT01006191.1.p1 GENE.GHVT01006191.1~~GHVT01006191.1.p1  ORF type:complete len:228 (+),score=65.85 GHVT01006191.1:134-817(+)